MSLFKNKPTLSEQPLAIEKLIPNVPNHYIASNGVFRQMISNDVYRVQQLSTIDNMVFTKSLNLQQGVETIKLLRGTLPYSFLHKLIEFFKYTYENYLSEAVGVIYQMNENCTKEELLAELSFDKEDITKHLLFENDFVLLIPSQNIKSDLVDFSNDIRYKLMDKCTLLTKKLELHSHHTMQAFFSTTDLNNQNDNCIYGVVGNIVKNVSLLYSYHNNTEISTTDIFGQEYVPVPLANYVTTTSSNDEAENDKELAKQLPFPFEWTKCYDKIRSFHQYTSKSNFPSYVNHNIAKEKEQEVFNLFTSRNSLYQPKYALKKSEMPLVNSDNTILLEKNYFRIGMNSLHLNLNPLLPYNLTKEQFLMLHKNPFCVKQRYSMRRNVEIKLNINNKIVNKYTQNYTAILPIFLAPFENGYNFIQQRMLEHSTVKGKELENTFYNSFSYTTVTEFDIELISDKKRESSSSNNLLNSRLHEAIFFAEDKIFTISSITTFDIDRILTTKKINEFEAEVIFTMYDLKSDKAKELYKILKQELILYQKHYYTKDSHLAKEIEHTYNSALYDVLNECEYVTVNVNPYNNVKCTNYIVTATNEKQFNKFLTLYEQCYWSFNHTKPIVIDGR